MRKSALVLYAAIVIVVVALAFAWDAQELQHASPRRLLETLQGYADKPHAPLVFVLAFLLGGFVFVPVTLLIAATGLAFGPAEGALYSLLGATLSGAASYGIGRYLAAGWLERHAGARIARVQRQLRKRGLIAIVLVRVVPSGPYTLTNLIAGAAGLRFRDFLFGTMLGLAPGIVTTVGLVHGLSRAWRAEDWITGALVAISIATLLAFAFFIRRAARRRARELHIDLPHAEQGRRKR